MRVISKPRTDTRLEIWQTISEDLWPHWNPVVLPSHQSLLLNRLHRLRPQNGLNRLESEPCYCFIVIFTLMLFLQIPLKIFVVPSQIITRLTSSLSVKIGFIFTQSSQPWVSAFSARNDFRRPFPHAPYFQSKNLERLLKSEKKPKKSDCHSVFFNCFSASLWLIPKCNLTKFSCFI